MSSTVVTFEAPEDVVRALDDLAASMSMSREQALQEMLRRSLTYDKAFRSSVEMGLQHADAGRLIDQTEVESRLLRWEQEAKQSDQVA